MHSSNRKALACHVYTNKQTLLQTAQAQVQNIETQKALNVRVILDNGSNRSYITQETREKLGLKCIAKENLNITVFGQTQCSTAQCDIV